MPAAIRSPGTPARLSPRPPDSPVPPVPAPRETCTLLNVSKRARTLALSAAVPLLCSCAVYDPPPVPSIDRVESGVLPSGSPLDIVFSEPIDPDTLRLSVVPLVTDFEGNLGDEDPSLTTQLATYFTHHPEKGQTGGKGELNAGATRFRITPEEPFPIGPQLAVLIERGLSDPQGNDTTDRTRIPFAYQFQCQGGKGTDKLPSGAYFFLFDIEKPIGVQIQILADLRVDPETGTLLAQFTSGDRNPDPDRCPFPCDEDDVCALLPEPRCVIPSEKAASVDEYPDFVPQPDPPTGYSFTVNGCAEDAADGSIGIATEPTDLVVQSPPVEAIGLAINCSFTADETGTLRCAGTSGAKDVKIGGQSAGPAEGASKGRPIPPEDTPEDLPPAP